MYINAPTHTVLILITYVRFVNQHLATMSACTTHMEATHFHLPVCFNGLQFCYAPIYLVHDVWWYLLIRTRTIRRTISLFNQSTMHVVVNVTLKQAIGFVSFFAFDFCRFCVVTYTIHSTFKTNNRFLKTIL